MRIFGPSFKRPTRSDGDRKRWQARADTAPSPVRRPRSARPAAVYAPESPDPHPCSRPLGLTAHPVWLPVSSATTGVTGREVSGSRRAWHGLSSPLAGKPLGRTAQAASSTGFIFSYTPNIRRNSVRRAGWLWSSANASSISSPDVPLARSWPKPDCAESGTVSIGSRTIVHRRADHGKIARLLARRTSLSGTPTACNRSRTFFRATHRSSRCRCIFE